ncbi:hypothetical protein [Zhouia amylolytica]|uniref:Uncharacterized protein n=1 Tax=Zhouia amylolytica AD3 TaxID=1286632 RepID=W2UL07_9FLAO|nr:hypothetical protein [Zhouia amylolytica]ETN94017.1 hypothetical protein P278_28210 [Zhouia amylolytica AD3]
MNKFDYNKPGNIEKKIIQILSERDHLDFMTIRALFPFGITSVERKCEDLITLGLITTEKIDSEVKYALTDDGAQAITQGIDHWVINKVFNNIKNNSYTITKSTPGLERYAIKKLEKEGEIYLEGKFYKTKLGQNTGAENIVLNTPPINSKKQSNKGWLTIIGDWYQKYRDVINLIAALATIFGFILAIFQFF